MALFNVGVWQGSRFILQWFIINLVGSLACLTAVALAQLEWSEGVSGSVFIPDVALTCLGNLAVFITAFTRGRLDMENGARDVLATTTGPKLNAVEVQREAPGCGLTTRPPNDPRDVDVVILSKYNGRPHSSLTQFMQYISHSHALESILLQVSPFTAQGTEGGCECDDAGACRCVEFQATEEIKIMLAHRLPRTLKQLSETRCLLPSLRCRNNGCHGCKRDLLYVEGQTDMQAAAESSGLGTKWRLKKGEPKLYSRDSPAAVCEALNESLNEVESSCICIPVHPRNADRWTKFMIKFLKSKEKEEKGIKVVVSDALQHYITQSAQELGWLFQTQTGCIIVREIYDSASLILLKVAEVIVNMGLTGWLRVDGFSSSLVARRAIRDYVVDSAGTGFAANAFLTEAVAFCSADGTNVCQVLWFRGGILSARCVSYMVGFVNLICSITWSVLIACGGNWAPSTPLSAPRLAVLIGAVGVALGMDCFDVYGGKVRALFSARAEKRVHFRARHKVRAQAHALTLYRDRIRAEAKAEEEAKLARAEARVEAEVEAGAGVEARVEVEAGAEAEVETDSDEDGEWDQDADGQWDQDAWEDNMKRELDQVMERAGDQDRALTQIRDQAWDQAWVRAWGLVAVVILEVGCIATLVVRLNVNKGLGRWVYSGMQVLVWVKWGIGSFFLSDKAIEGEDGSPYFGIRNKGTWVYCSALLLNAMLAGVRGKWVYSI